MLVLTVNCGFLSVLFFTLWSQQKADISGLGEWGWSYLLISLWGMLSLSLPSPIPWLSGVLLGTAWSLGLILMYEGLRRFLNRPRDFRISQGLFALTMLLQIIAAQQQSIQLRYFATSSLLVILLLLALSQLASNLKGYVSTRIFACLVLAIALLFSSRLLLVLTSDHQVGLYASNPQQLVINIILTLLFPLAGMALLLMANHRVQQRLTELATRDSLTGALNRRAFLVGAAAELARSRRYRSSLSLLQIDLDHFKQVNDRYGHLAGDRVLIDFVTRVGSLLRVTDVFGRTGGEEFTLLLPQTGAAEALLIAERIRTALAASEVTPGYTASVGVTTTQGEAKSLESLLGKADEALYRAKANGRNRVELEVFEAA
jgi:diguanylate cyclase (GGDEF)-like protein